MAALAVNPWFWVVLVGVFVLGLPRRLWLQNRRRGSREPQGTKRP